jgi:TetR/AcrR family transcriptional repressor of mexJK operon
MIYEGVMSKRKQEEFEERRLQIIDGALKVFSTKGFREATNKDIASAAGIKSPGLIYHYFKDKADLLRAVAEEHAPPLRLLHESDQMMALPLEEALTLFGLTYMRLLDDPVKIAFMKMSMGEALRDPEFARMLGETGPLRVWRFLAGYLQDQMEKGVLRRMDAHLAARQFVGPLLMQFLTHSVLQLPEMPGIAPETIVAANVEIFVRGLKADT